MNQIRRERTEPGCTAVLEALSHRLRRDTLQYVRRNGAASLEEIAGALSGAAEAVQAGPGARPEALRASLQHQHLPKLEAAALLGRTGARVTTGDHPVLEDPRLDDLLSVEADDWDDVLACLSDPRYRTALSVLAAHDGAVDRSALALEVARRAPDIDRDDVERVQTELHHVQLPKLADAGLIAFEDDSESVRYLGHSELGDLSQMPDAVAGSRREIPL